MNNHFTSICYQYGHYKAPSSPMISLVIQKQAILNLANAVSHFGRKQQENKSLVLIGLNNVDLRIMGYAVLLWKSRFRAHQIKCSPEIMALFILPAFRKWGI